MTPTQIKKAQELLSKRQALLSLVDRHGTTRGKILSGQVGPVLKITSEGFEMLVTIDTLELWIKQAKKAQKMGILE